MFLGCIFKIDKYVLVSYIDWKVCFLKILCLCCSFLALFWIWWLPSCISCNPRPLKLLNLPWSTGVPIINNYWSRTSNTSKNLLLWKNATCFQSNCCILGLLGYYLQYSSYIWIFTLINVVVEEFLLCSCSCVHYHDSSGF